MHKLIPAIFITLFAPSLFAQDESEQEWISLFNGTDLDDWTPKFTGYELGVNYLDTFRVEDGVFKVSYDNWTDFDGEFGHIF